MLPTYKVGTYYSPWDRDESNTTERLHSLHMLPTRNPGCDSTGATKRSYPRPEARDGGWEEQPHVQGVVAARAQEGLEEQFHVQGQEGRW